MAIELTNNYSGIRNTNVSNTPNSVLGKNALSMQDFFSLMVAELSNQDMFNTVDNTQYITQLAQFSMMQAISDLSETFSASFSELSRAYSTYYGISLIGKEVTLAQLGDDGSIFVRKGIVQSVNLFNGSAEIVVDGKAYGLSNVMEVKEPNIIIPDNSIREIEEVVDKETDNKNEEVINNEINNEIDNGTDNEIDEGENDSQKELEGVDDGE